MYICCRKTYILGEMAEWSIAAVLKTVDCNRSGGSNPSFSANINLRHRKVSFLFLPCLQQPNIYILELDIMIFKTLEFDPEEVLFVFALESEAGNYFNSFKTIFSGIGKVNATLALTQAIVANKPKLIINLGTAGSNIFDKNEVINCTQFIQRDMDVTGLGFKKFKTPFTQTPIVLEYGIKIPNSISGVCGTGDNFETNLNQQPYNVVDMEAYALALVAQNYNIPFLCLKFISDGANHDAAKSWENNITSAPEAFYKTLFV